jgi:hypothetical protein
MVDGAGIANLRAYPWLHPFVIRIESTNIHFWTD